MVWQTVQGDRLDTTSVGADSLWLTMRYAQEGVLAGRVGGWPCRWGCYMELTPAQHEVLRGARARRRLRDLITIEELSGFLRISVRTLQRMHASGQGPPRIRRSHPLVYPVSELIPWVQARTLP